MYEVIKIGECASRVFLSLKVGLNIKKNISFIGGIMRLFYILICFFYYDLRNSLGGCVQINKCAFFPLKRGVGLVPARKSFFFPLNINGICPAGAEPRLLQTVAISAVRFLEEMVWKPADLLKAPPEEAGALRLRAEPSRPSASRSPRKGTGGSEHPANPTKITY